MADDLLYRYARPSSLGPSGMELATSGETVVAEPYVRGLLERPDQGAAAMLWVADLTATGLDVARGRRASTRHGAPRRPRAAQAAARRAAGRGAARGGGVTGGA